MKFNSWKVNEANLATLTIFFFLIYGVVFGCWNLSLVEGTFD